jgi:signal transduction histidine kinase
MAEKSPSRIGLFISQRLAQAMGGGITVMSRAGKGSTFTLRLRLNEVEEDGRLFAST